MTNAFVIKPDTTYYFENLNSITSKHAIEIFERDIKKIFDVKMRRVYTYDAADIVIKYAESTDRIYQQTEGYSYQFVEQEDRQRMFIKAADDLGLMYSLLNISNEYFGISPFWYWLDQEIQKVEEIVIPEKDYFSTISAVKHRGWFVNDEVCLLGWTDVYPPPKQVWHPVFETLLRCFGNMVIPGTDLPRDGIHWQLASDMGLWVTYHHAEPLGANFFLRAYPHLEPSYDKYPELFEGLWREGIIKYKGMNNIWVLGFRGQGDCPFWENDPQYDTPESRGKVISEVIAKQHQILKEYVDNPKCVTYLYGEVMELYNEGHIKFNENIVKVWSDNGYGEMVSRRQGNWNPRILSLPTESNEGTHGVYYHATFHDLQASNHLTMLGVKPELLISEIAHFTKPSTNEYMLVNCGNIRPHVYILDIIKEMWKYGDINLETHLFEFASSYFNTYQQEICECINEYFSCSTKYGQYDFDVIGDEYYHHPVRMLAKQWLSNKHNENAERFNWSCQGSFKEQMLDYQSKCQEGLEKWSRFMESSEKLVDKLEGRDQVVFKDFIMLQVELHRSGCEGVMAFVNSYLSYRDEDYVEAFLDLTKAIRSYESGLEWMEIAQHDKWKNFFRADWLTNVRCTIDTLKTVRSYIRVLGDGPDFFRWYKTQIMPKEERNIYLENTQRQVFDDDTLAQMLLNKKLNG